METAEKEKEEVPTNKIENNTNNNEDKNSPLNQENSPDMNNTNNNTQKNNLEINKLQGFDVLEQLPKKSFNDNYNQEFYSTLDNLKFLSLSIPDEDKLFYHFEQNENASISANAGQVLKTFMELFMNKMTIRKTLRQCKKDFKAIRIDLEDIEPSINEEIRTEILKMEKRLQNFLVEQKTETIRLIKEIANLQKEKDQIKEEIEQCLERLDKLEKIIGTNKDYYKTIGEGKMVNKKEMEVKKKKSVGGVGTGLPGLDNNSKNGEDNSNMRMTGNTVSNPGEGLSEHFNVNTIGANNFS